MQSDDATWQDPTVVLNSGAPSPFLLLGDHAGRIVPPVLENLGLSEPDLSRHIAWDIGVFALGQHLSRMLDATFISQRYSRLVIDCNRHPDRADAIPEVSDQSAIPGNQSLSAEDRADRISRVYRPYHDRIAMELEDRATRGTPTTVVALHSFTPVMQGFVRPWRFGVLHLGGSAFSNATLARLRAELDPQQVGDNEPYKMDGVDFTIPHHAIGRGQDYVELEVRQDLLADEAGQLAIAERLARLLPAALQDCQR